MPRSKSRRQRKPALSPVVETRRNAGAPRLQKAAVKPAPGLDRHRRPDLRPPKFPGRLGGR